MENEKILRLIDMDVLLGEIRKDTTLNNDCRQALIRYVNGTHMKYHIPEDGFNAFMDGRLVPVEETEEPEALPENGKYCVDILDAVIYRPKFGR